MFSPTSTDNGCGAIKLAFLPGPRIWNFRVGARWRLGALWVTCLGRVCIKLDQSSRKGACRGPDEAKSRDASPSQADNLSQRSISLAYNAASTMDKHARLSASSMACKECELPRRAGQLGACSEMLEVSTMSNGGLDERLL